MALTLLDPKTRLRDHSLRNIFPRLDEKGTTQESAALLAAARTEPAAR